MKTLLKLFFTPIFFISLFSCSNKMYDNSLESNYTKKQLDKIEKMILLYKEYGCLNFKKGLSKKEIYDKLLIEDYEEVKKLLDSLRPLDGKKVKLKMIENKETVISEENLPKTRKISDEDLDLFLKNKRHSAVRAFFSGVIEGSKTDKMEIDVVYLYRHTAEDIRSNIRGAIQPRVGSIVFTGNSKDYYFTDAAYESGNNIFIFKNDLGHYVRTFFSYPLLYKEYLTLGMLDVYGNNLVDSGNGKKPDKIVAACILEASLATKRYTPDENSHYPMMKPLF